MYTAPLWSFSKGAPIATSWYPSRLRSVTAAMAVPNRAPHGSFLLVQPAVWGVQHDWFIGFKVNSCLNLSFCNGAKKKQRLDHHHYERWLSVQRSHCKFLQKSDKKISGGTCFLYLTEFVDVNSSLLILFWAHVHWSSNQEQVCVGIVIHVDSLQDTAEVGSNLHKVPITHTDHTVFFCAC